MKPYLVNNLPIVHDSETADRLERYIDNSIHNHENDIDELVRTVEYLLNEIRDDETQKN